MHMLRYMQALAKVVVKSPLVWIALVVCQVVFLTPFVTAETTWGDHLGQDFYRESRLEPLEQAWAAGYPGMEGEELEGVQRKLELVRAACSAGTPREYFALRAEIATLDEQDVMHRALIGPTLLEAQSEKTFFTRLSRLEDPQVYLSYREAPTWFYLAAKHATMPVLMWMLPGLTAALVVLHVTRGRQLLAQAPRGAFAAHTAQIFTAFVIAAASLLVIVLPAALVTAMANGLGDISYPVVNATRSLLLDFTVGEVQVRAAVLYACTSFLCVAAMFAIVAFLPHAWLGAAMLAVAAVCAQPLVSDYVELQNVWTGQTEAPLSVDYNLDEGGGFTFYSPLTYLRDGAEIAGYANYYPHAEQTIDDRLAVEDAAAVLAGWAAAFCFIDMATLTLGRARMKRLDVATDAPEASAHNGLAARSLTVSHGKNVLMGSVSLDIRGGQIVGLVAPNGRGKTTLIEALVGVGTARRKGGVRIEGVGLENRAAFFQNVLYVPCDAKLLYGNLTAADHIELAASLWPHRVDTDRLIEYCGIEDYLHKPVAFCSSGMKQQIALAVAYCTGVRYLLLDEPMNALDPGNVSLNSRILERLALEGHGVLLSSHILSNLDEVCTSVVFIEGGRLVKHDVCSEVDIKSLYERAYGEVGMELRLEKGKGGYA